MKIKQFPKEKILQWTYGDHTSLYDGMKQCKTKRERQLLAITCYYNGMITRQVTKQWLTYIKGVYDENIL